MARPIFVFGTLMDDGLRAAAMGARWRRLGRPATLPAHDRRPVPGQDYPALGRRLGGAVRGLLLPAPNAATLAALDRHEGPEYLRRPVWVRSGGRLRRADCYLSAPGLPLAPCLWRLDGRWRRRRENYLRRQFSPASSRTTA